MGDKTRGLYDKYEEIRRTDGSSDSSDEKHYQCDYFVLDLTHDPHAWPALKAYADSCRADYPLLAADLDAKREQKARSFAGLPVTQEEVEEALGKDLPKG